jgi:predicted dehydrogenase
MQPESALVVGNGFSGTRFVRALRHIEDTQPGVARLAGICDRNIARLTGLTGVSTFTELSTAIGTIDPTVIVVAVNESEHFTVLNQLSAVGSKRRLLIVEKPFTETVAQAMAISPLISEAVVAVNFTERYSPILEAYRRWASDCGGVVPTRIEFFWGKNRIRDSRPTIGVLSELTHPLDLVKYLFGIQDPRIVSVHARESDFASSTERCLDSIDVCIETSLYRLAGHASFCWSERLRRLFAVLRNTDGTSMLVNFDFDMPRWDCDSVTIRLCGSKEIIFEHRVNNSSFPGELDEIGKVALFTSRSIESFRLQSTHAEQVDVAGAIENQQLTAAIADAIASTGGPQWTPLFQ